VQFENDQLRVARRACAPEIPCDLSAGADTPALLVALTPGRVQAEGSDATALALGQTQWLGPARSGRCGTRRPRRPSSCSSSSRAGASGARRPRPPPARRRPHRSRARRPRAPAAASWPARRGRTSTRSR
jgi:hypothetical protein